MFCVYFKDLRHSLFVIKKSSRQQLNNEIGRHKTSLKKLDEALKTIEDLKVIIKEKDKLIGHSNIYSHRSIAQNLSRRSKNNTDLASQIGNTECRNFRIFLPFRLYLKSILVIFKTQKLPF